MGQEVSIDVGPVSTKVSVLLPGLPQPSFSSLYFYLPSVSSTVYFLKYLNSDLPLFRSHPIYSLLSTAKGATIKGTGSNLKRKASFFNREFGVEIESVPATDLVLPALDRVMEENPDAFFTYTKVHWPLLPNGRAYKDSKRTSMTEKTLYPYVLANLRSGLSVYRVDSPTSARMISGSSMGGATFAGIMKLGTDYTSVCQALDGAKSGDNSAVDITVGDIYGTDYSSIGLKKDLIASSCGKMRNAKEYRDEDLARSVAMMLALNVAQIVHLAAQAEEISTIIVAGSALEADPLMAMLQKATNCWAGPSANLVFCEYGLYLASFGALMPTPTKEE